MAGERRWARVALAASATALALGVAAQAFLAGMALFDQPGWWIRHRDFVHMFEGASPLAVVFAYVARSSRRAKWLSWSTIALLLAQYVTAGQRGLPGRAPLVAFHTVSALLLFWASAELARVGWSESR